MARAKNYDREKAVEAAMLAFWKKGYGALGVREIESETSINRFALQTDFGGKQGLFLEALQKYLEISDETALKPLQSGGLTALISFFRQLAHGEAEDPRDGGCLMVNTVIENANLGIDDVSELTARHYSNMQRMFELALGWAQEEGELAHDFDLSSAAKMLLTFAMGVEVYVRMNGTVSAASAQVEFLVSQIESWRLKK
ncbi:TetR family transcriptional regulator [uncultured Litoreibacter sp.]|uniref:TetR/AcrR family transcriptional regulator n=1 Tax=uncultured Litoreibacter sp. TaxID=1392394 RepID=UPI00262EE4DB|nr:TetR family transcriptional regulator [uncultured Litoreibacter sp.]